jgi:AraC-like DNA-binding protein
VKAFDLLERSSVPEPECRKLGHISYRIEGFTVASIAHGELTLELPNGENARLLEADLLIIPEGTHVDAQGRSSEAEVLLLRIPLEWMEAAFSLAGLSSVRRLPKLVAIQRAATELARRGVRLLRRISTEPEFAATRAPLRFVSTVLELVALGDEAEPGVAKPVFLRRTRRHGLLEALAAVQSEPLENLSLSALAARLGVSERQVSRLFQENLGMSFRTWATELRLERARKLLAETDLSIIDVAGETGWSSLAHFNSIFRRQAGLTPSRYRIVYRTSRRDFRELLLFSAPGAPLEVTR